MMCINKRITFEILIRLLILCLVITAIRFRSNIYLFMLSGLINGAYYGWFNDIIWKHGEKLIEEIPYRSHQLWIHTLSGIIGSIAFYILANSINLNDPINTLPQLGLREFVLFILALLGYLGLFARTLWFYSSKGGN